MKKVSTLEERLSALLDNSGVVDSSVAEAIGVSRQALSSWRTGVRSPKETAILALADYFKVDPVWLMGYDVPPTPEASPRRLPTSADEERLLTLWRNADDTIRPVVLELLELHPRPDAKKGEA